MILIIIIIMIIIIITIMIIIITIIITNFIKISTENPFTNLHAVLFRRLKF